ncbi:MAG: adenosylmethionine decarboxylase [bacterium]|nr:adenosylmethionine decarboxylase [bacterium]
MSKRKKFPAKEPYRVFGKHLTIDAYGISRKKLESHKGVFDLLNDLPAKLGMRKLTIPYVVFCEEDDKKGDWGLSGFVMIYESHISCHTWPELGYVSMDVYSCRDFDEKKTIALLKRHWGCREMKTEVIMRG